MFKSFEKLKILVKIIILKKYIKSILIYTYKYIYKGLILSIPLYLITVAVSLRTARTLL